MVNKAYQLPFNSYTKHCIEKDEQQHYHSDRDYAKKNITTSILIHLRITTAALHQI